MLAKKLDKYKRQAKKNGVPLLEIKTHQLSNLLDLEKQEIPSSDSSDQSFETWHDAEECKLAK